MDSLLNTYLNLLKCTENDPRHEAMLFNYETTTRNDFRDGAIENIKRTVYKEKPKCLTVRPPPLNDIQTLTEWKVPHMPLEMLVKPKEVVRTNPHKIQAPYMNLEDFDKERVRATRPRLVMTPAVSMDDIVDDYKRELLTKETYRTTQMAIQSETAWKHELLDNVKAPLHEQLAPANPITLKKLQFPIVSPEWRMQSVSWDGRQRRAHSDPCKEFYLARPLLCEICKETSAREMNRKMLRKMKR